MSQDKVNMDFFPTDSGVDSAGEGLHILARMIARRLLARKPGAIGQHPRPVLPPGGVHKETDSTAPEGFDNKQAAPPSDSKRLDAGCPDAKGEVDG